MKWFHDQYDKLTRAAYTRILGVNHIPVWSWSIQKLPPRLGGVLLRTGYGLSAKKYSASLASVKPNIRNFLMDWNPLKVFEKDAWRELEHELELKSCLRYSLQKSHDKKPRNRRYSKFSN